MRQTQVGLKQLFSAMGVAFATLAACAADRTWNGAGADNNWNTSDNWGGTAPVAGDALFFGGSLRPSNSNDLAVGTPIAGLTFNSGASAFTLAGSSITLDGNISLLSAGTHTINLPLILSATRMIGGTNSMASALTVNGVISGPGGLDAAVSNTLTLTGNNAYEGTTIVTNGCRLYISHGHALGSAQAGTWVYGRASGSFLKVSGGIEVPEPITLVGQVLPYSPCFYSGTGRNVLNGLLTKVTETRISVDSGANSLVLAGGVIAADGGDLRLHAGTGASIIVTNNPIAFGSLAAVTMENQGVLIFAVPGSTYSRLNVGAESRVIMAVPGAFPVSASLDVGVSWNKGGVIDLNGFDLTTSMLRTTGRAVDPGYLAVTSAAPATLTVNQSGASVFAGDVAGAIRLVKNDAGTITFTNVVSTTTGDIVVNAGVLAVAESGGFGSSTNIRVNGGMLELRNSASLADSAALWVAEGAQVKIKAGVSEAIDKLYVDGEQQATGTWGSSVSGAEHVNDAVFSGGGTVDVASAPAVAYTDALWNAGGADSNLSTPANWEGGALPAFDGSARATFASSGNVVTVDLPVSLFRTILNANTNLTVAAGAGVITNGAGGVKAGVPNALSRTYTLAEDIVLAGPQTWSVTNSGSGVTTLDVTGQIDGGPDADLTKRGNGVLRLAGNNTYGGKTTVQTNGYVIIAHSNALGSTTGATDIQNGGYIRIDGGSGITVAEPLTMTGDAALGWSGTLRSNTGSNIWSGKITAGGARISANSPIEVIGGVDGGSLVCSAYAPGFIRLSEKPVTAGALTSHTGGGGVILAVGGNTFSTFSACGNWVRIDVPNAWLPTVTLTQGDGGNGTSILNLNGNSQTVGQWQTLRDNSETRLLYSVSPATLTVNQSANTLFNGSVTGAVSIVKLGTGNLTLTNAFITTSGSFTVSNGTLTVSNKGTFGPNCTNVYVGGSGMLLLSNSVVIADAAAVRMPASGTSTAKINLAPGVDETVGWLYYGDVMMRAGTYGSASSGASVKDDTHFSGAGILRVLKDRSGTLIGVL